MPPESIPRPVGVPTGAFRRSATGLSRFLLLGFHVCQKRLVVLKPTLDNQVRPVAFRGWLDREGDDTSHLEQWFGLTAWHIAPYLLCVSESIPRLARRPRCRAGGTEPYPRAWPSSHREIPGVFRTRSELGGGHRFGAPPGTAVSPASSAACRRKRSQSCPRYPRHPNK